jgi:RNA polymerase sigma-70 factor (ECF subfamily)
MVSSVSRLVATFIEASPVALRPALARLPELTARLTALVGDGQAAWPQLPLDPLLLMRFVARQLSSSGAEEQDSAARSLASDEIAESLEGLRAGDLYLACACASGSSDAIGAFDRGYMSEVDHALARMHIDGTRLADVKQLVRQRLFVGQGGGSGKISEYAGRGDLRRWVRSVAVRTCLNELRKGKREVLADDETLIARHAIPVDDPEVSYMKRTYAAEFRSAFSAALAQADAREQTLLRYHHVDGLNIDEIGAIYRVHRVTAFRWLEKAKERLVRTTLEDLRARLRLSPRELDSVLRMIRSQVHLSLVRHLGGASDRVEDDAMELDAADLVELEAEPGQRGAGALGHHAAPGDLIGEISGLTSDATSEPVSDGEPGGNSGGASPRRARRGGSASGGGTGEPHA